MSIQARAEFLLAQAKFADEQAAKIKDKQVSDTWKRIADSCRHLAKQYGITASKKRETRLFVCPDCSTTGWATWETGGQLGSNRRLISLQGGFHAETGRTATGETLIVCNVCDTIQD